MNYKKIKFYFNTKPRPILILFVSVLLIIALLTKNDNYIAEALSIFITILIIEWLVNGPKRVLIESISSDLDTIKYLFFSRLLSSIGFETEYLGYLDSYNQDVSNSSVDKRLEKATDILTRLTTKNFETKYLDYNNENFDGLNHNAILLLEHLKEFRDNYFSSLDFIARDSIIKCIRSTQFLIMHSNLMSKDQKVKDKNNFVIGYCAYNVYDIIQEINNISKAIK